MTTRDDVEAAALKAMVDVRACAPRDVPRLATPPSALAFATEYLAKNMPFVCAPEAKPDRFAGCSHQHHPS